MPEGPQPDADNRTDTRAASPSRPPSIGTDVAWIAAIAFVALFTSVGGLNPINLLMSFGLAIALCLLFVVTFALPYYPVALAAVACLWFLHPRIAHSLPLRLIFIVAGGALGYGVFLATGLASEPKNDLWDPKLAVWLVVEAGVVSAILVDLARVRVLRLTGAAPPTSS